MTGRTLLVRWWHRHGDVALVVLGAVLVSGKGIIAKLLYRDGVTIEPILLLRAWLSLPLVWAWALYRVPFGALFGGDRRLIAGAMLAGAASYYAGAWMNFIALTMIDASLERVLLFTYPTMVVVARALALRRWPSRKLLSAVALTYLGVACAVGGLNVELLESNGLGAALVLGSAGFFAYYMIANERVAMNTGSVPFIVHATLAAVVALSLHAVFISGDGFSRVLALPSRAVWLITLMTALTNVLPLFLFSASIKRIGAQRAAVVSTVGPPSTLIMASLILGETMHAVQIVGAGLIIAGIVVLETRRAAAPL